MVSGQTRRAPLQPARYLVGQAFPVDSDAIAEIGVDDKGRLYVSPQAKAFPHIYREAMEVHWDSEGKYLCSPAPPRSQLATPIWWFKQILSAAKAQECGLVLETATRWNNVPQDLKDEIVSFQGNADAWPALRERRASSRLHRPLPRTSSSTLESIRHTMDRSICNGT